MTHSYDSLIASMAFFTTERRLPKFPVEEDLPEGARPLSTNQVLNHGLDLCRRVNYLVFTADSAQLRQSQIARAVSEDSRGDPDIEKSFILKLQGKDYPEVYRFIFRKGNIVGVHRRLETSEGSFKDRPWEQMLVKLSAEDPSIVHQNRGIYNKTDQVDGWIEKNNTYASARSDILLKGLFELWFTRKTTLGEGRLAKAAKDLFRQLEELDPQKISVIGKFRRIFTQEGLIIEVTPDPNDRYSDFYRLNLNPNDKSGVLEREKLDNFLQEINSWEKVGVQVATDAGPAEIIHQSQGILVYSRGTLEVIEEKNTTTAQARADLLIERFKSVFLKKRYPP